MWGWRSWRDARLGQIDGGCSAVQRGSPLLGPCQLLLSVLHALGRLMSLLLRTGVGTDESVGITMRLLLLLLLLLLVVLSHLLRLRLLLQLAMLTRMLRLLQLAMLTRMLVLL